MSARSLGILWVDRSFHKILVRDFSNISGAGVWLSIQLGHPKNNML